MKFKAEIDVMPLQELLDPQGKAVMLGLKNLDVHSTDVRIGKHISIEIEAGSKEEADTKIQAACQKLLANPIMEGFSYQLSELS
ncbi:MAG: phosphoribosylformylglycinamidine synthase subunit PurS [Cytophagales bacterium]|nr:MAG: phosphoribosylformylglycinamidine synthase subunit PurS [Cytophagales bacterium]